jgi:hypothetical protein
LARPRGSDEVLSGVVAVVDRLIHRSDTYPLW